jgi:tRNA threonylcarbamoyladenosine biosynthesis protein TsaE
MRLHITSMSVENTQALGLRLGAALRAGDVVCLSGDLGAGKTALARGIGVGWGAAEAVNSPTFVFEHAHHRHTDRQVLHHVDCYRLTSDAEAATIGLDDILAGEGATIIEWPERVLSWLPADRLWITIEADPTSATTRHFTLEASGARYVAILNDLRAVYPPQA